VLRILQVLGLIPSTGKKWYKLEKSGIHWKKRVVNLEKLYKLEKSGLNKRKLGYQRWQLFYKK
jgi:hypothetical protein